MPWRRGRKDDDFRDEIHAHLELEVDRLVADGVDPVDARAMARRTFGNVARAQERFHERSRWTWFEQFVRDLHYAWRGLWRSKAFVATTVLTLAVGLGLVTVVFTVFNAYVLRPFAVRDPNSLYELVWHSQEAGGRTFRWTDYQTLQTRSDLFDAVIATGERYAMSSGSTLAVGFVSGNYFDTLGARLSLGRGLAEYDAAAPGSAPVAVLSDQLWTRRFDRNPGVLGQELELNGRKLTIVGISRPEFQGLEDAPQDLWVPLTMYPLLTGQDLFNAGGTRQVHVVARLKPGVTAAQAQSAITLEPFASRIAGRLDAVQAELRSKATPVRLTWTLAAVLAPVFAAFGLVLVAACANASNVMLARANARHRELGIRLSLGASRGRVVRQLLTEGFLLAALAGGLGLAIGSVALRAVMPVFFDLLPAGVASLVRVVPLDFDRRVFLFALSAATAATVLFALLPALQATRLSLTDALRGQAGRGIRASALRNVLVAGQVAVSLMLLIVAATLVRNGVSVGATDLVLQPAGVISVNQRGQDQDLIARAAAALEAEPRVGQVVVTSQNPLFGQFIKTPVVRETGIVAATYMFVSPGYFSMLGIPILHGRGFRPEETGEASGVTIISAAGAKSLWPGEDPLGKTVRIQIEPPASHVNETVRLLRGAPGAADPGTVVLTVVGVAQDVVSGFLFEGKDSLHLYLPTTRTGAHAQAILVRGRAGTTLRREALQPVLQRVHSDPLLFEVVPLEQMVSVQMFPLRMASWIGSFLAMLALALSIAGVYGVLTYTLGQRAQEIGIRMALGASGGAVVRLVLRQSARLAGIGAAFGLVVAFIVMSLVSVVVRLDNVSVLDLGAFAAGLGLVALAVLVASYGPARSASRVDPAIALRSET
jgi:predicted permease